MNHTTEQWSNLLTLPSLLHAKALQVFSGGLQQSAHDVDHEQCVHGDSESAHVRGGCEVAVSNGSASNDAEMHGLRVGHLLDRREQTNAQRQGEARDGGDATGHGVLPRRGQRHHGPAEESQPAEAQHEDEDAAHDVGIGRADVAEPDGR
eukprot:CAMPEP_0198108210 /NCGR_PEP_ID=MMETSP1442-20131203/286_1 /TAXON_ID= /ORGANISM="Craspedostauros australis, Strain CCMP3328" /LENGTH=149 /DNA_ID=CAMNT_0043763439 /DNA_START=404 /DNA_END=849 /DNA_ORIENTATION=+